MQIALTVHGDDHVATLREMNNLANTLNRQGDFEGARELRVELLKRQRQVLGSQHPSTVLTMLNMARNLKTNFDDPEGALPLQQEAFAARLAMLGPEDERTTVANDRVVSTLSMLGRTADAIDAAQSLCWLLEADDASLTPPQRRIRDEVKRVGFCSK